MQKRGSQEPHENLGLGQVTALIAAGTSVESGLRTAYSFSDVLIDRL
jgi:hypothetical protein